MSRQIAVVAAAVMLIAYTTAQSDEPSGDFARGPFAVSPAGQSAVMLDTGTGESWLLQASTASHEPPVWIPLHRLADEDEAARWHAEQEDIANQLAHQAQRVAEIEAERQQAERVRQHSAGEDLLREIRESLIELESQFDASR